MRAVEWIQRYIVITVAALFYSLGISLFLSPNHLAPGGVSGLAVILHSVIPIPIGVGSIILIFNIPIMLAGAWKFGRRFIMSSIYTTVISSLAINMIPDLLRIRALTDDDMLAAVIGGALLGVSMGMLFRLDTTTGGADIIVKIIRQYRPYMKSGQIFLILDGFVVFLSAVVFQNIETALFAIVAIYLSSEFLNKTLYVGDEATLIYIVSQKRKELEQKIITELNIGATLIPATGAYLKEKRDIILCVVHRRGLAKIRSLIKKTDADAFMIVTSANEVFGKGFKDQNQVEV